MKAAAADIIRTRREELRAKDQDWSLRRVASRVGIHPSLLSKLERGEEIHLSEKKIIALAKELNLDADYLLAVFGKIASDVQLIIQKRPELFAELIRELRKAPDKAILSIVREVRDGDW